MAIISAGNLCKCSFGTIPIPLASTNVSVQVENTPVLTPTDTSSIVSFGLCNTPSNPAVQVIFGAPVPAPCVANIITPWSNPKMNVLACGKRVCTDKSTCMCMYGGVITITQIKPGTVK